MIISKVISGGQTGVDQAALFAAAELNIPTGGHAPKGWRTDAGSAPWLADYGLVEHESPLYPPRTEDNVKNSFITLILGNHNSPGCSLTKKLCNKHGKEYVLFKNMDQADLDRYYLLQGHHDRAGGLYILNVAGNRESSYPGIEKMATYFLTQLFKRTNG